MKKSGKTRLGVFDIDGTIFRSSLLVELINGLVEYGVFPQIAKKEMEREYLRWLDRKGGYEQYIQKVIAIHLKYIPGKPVPEVEAVAQQTVQYLKNRVYRFTRDLLRDLKEQGYHLVCISGSPTYIVSKYAKTFGFKAYFGSEYETKDRVFTGRVTNLDTFYKKAHVLGEYLKSSGLQADLKRSIAVGDTESDIPMLEMVGHPIAVNPNIHLAEHARRKGWDVVVERKDVIYNVRNYKLINHQ